MKPRMNTEQLSRNEKESHRGERGGSVLGAHASSVLRVSNTLHAGCARSQEPAEENPWQLAKDFCAFSWERTHPACRELEALSTLEACAPRGQPRVSAVK